MALTVTCAKSGLFARCIGFKLRYTNSSVGLFSRQYATEKSKKKGGKKEPPKKPLKVPPKRPMTAYLDFYVAHLDEIRQNNKDIKKISEIAKIGSKMWKELDEESKKEYEEVYKTRMEAYKEELKKFNDSLTEAEKTELKEEKIRKKEEKMARLKKREKKETQKKYHMPSRPATAYALFVKQKYKDRPADVKTKDYMATCAEAWKNLSEEEKKVFFDEAHGDKEVYEGKISAWVQQMVEEGNGEHVPKYMLKKELEILGRPKNARSAFQMYLAETHTDVANNKWKKMTDKEKEHYIVQAAGEKDRVKEEMKDWMENIDALGKEEFVLEAEALLKRRSKKSTSKSEEKK